MKVIDFLKKGNVIRFYLGADDCKDYYGDDWDDTPYEHNAGTVYDEYVTGFADVALDIDYCVLEPADGVVNSAFCKCDFVEKKTPCIIAFHEDEDTWVYGDSFAHNVGRTDIAKVYFGDDIDTVLEMLKDKCNAHSFGIKFSASGK